MNEVKQLLVQALWRICNRPERPLPWAYGDGNLPWNDPDFSRRMLREHLDESHGAASRTTPERMLQLDWLWSKLGLQTGSHFFDVTCGPGLYAVELARRGCQVTGVDFSPAAIAYAQQLAQKQKLDHLCCFYENDVRELPDFGDTLFDAAGVLYGQLAVFPPDQARHLLTKIARRLKPGAKLCLELLNPERVDRQQSTWWFTDETGLWGDAPFLHLGERFWDEATQTSMERYQIIHLDSGRLDEILLCDQTYTPAAMTSLLHQTGFTDVTVYAAWDGLPLYDAGEWIVYVASRHSRPDTPDITSS